MPNTRFRYEYRDGEGCRYARAVVFAGPPSATMEARLRAALDDRRYFVAHQLGLPDAFPWVPGPHLPSGRVHPRGSMDHPWHRVLDMACLVPTAAPPTDVWRRDLVTFVGAVEALRGEWDILSSSSHG